MADPNTPAPRTFELTKELLEAAKELILYTSEVQKKTSDTAEAVTKTTRRASKRIAVNATTSMDDIIGAMDKGLEKAGKKAKKQVEDVHAAIRKEQERTEKAQLKSIQTYLRKNRDVKQRSHSFFEAISPEHRTAYGKLLKRKAKHFILGESSAAGSAALGQIAGFAMKIAPQIAIMLSFAEAVRTVVERFFDLDKKTVALAMNLGGDYKTALDIQVHTYGEVVEATNLTKESIEEMGMAFLQAGIPLTSHKEDLIDYMTVAGNMHKVLGTSFDQLARYTETLRHAGKRAGQMFDEYDAMYQKMEKYQLTVADFNSSLTEGDDLWSEFGSRSNRTLTQLQSDVMQTKGIFKSFNLDVKSTGSLMQAMMGDPKAQMRQAALISAMKGKSHNAAFIDVATGSAQGAQDLIETLVRYATSFKDAHYGESSSQLARLGDNGYASVLKQRGMLENNMSKQFNMSQKMVSQILSDYEGFMGVNPGSSIDHWVQKRLKDHQDPSKAGGLMQALKTKENSIESSLIAISNTVMEIADHIAYIALDQSPKFLSAINSVLKFIPNTNITEVLSFDKWKAKRNSTTAHETSSADRLSERANKSGSRKAESGGLKDWILNAVSKDSLLPKFAENGLPYKLQQKRQPDGSPLPPLFTPPPVRSGVNSSSISIKKSKKYPDYVLKGAYKAWADTGVPIEATLAQWKLEGASDGSLLASKYNNPFGIKAMKGLSKKYGTVTLPTTEVWGGKSHRTMGKFQVFPDKETAFVERGKMLMNPKGYYKKSIPLANDLSKYLPAMGKVYATDPLYAKKLKNVIDRDGLSEIANELKQQNEHLSKLLQETVAGNEHRQQAHKESKMRAAMTGNQDARLQQQVINQSIL